MSRTFLAMPAATILGTLAAAPADAEEALHSESCVVLRHDIDTRSRTSMSCWCRRSTRCREPVNPSVDGVTVDFAAAIRVADHALRPGIVVATCMRRCSGTPGVRLNVRVDGTASTRRTERWGEPRRRRRRSLPSTAGDGITVTGCDDCAVIHAEVTGARSGGVVVVARAPLVDGRRRSAPTSTASPAPDLREHGP